MMPSVFRDQKHSVSWRSFSTISILFEAKNLVHLLTPQWELASCETFCLTLGVVIHIEGPQQSNASNGYQPWAPLA